jgi:hypothetical protein
LGRQPLRYPTHAGLRTCACRAGRLPAEDEGAGLLRGDVPRSTPVGRTGEVVRDLAAVRGHRLDTGALGECPLRLGDLLAEGPPAGVERLGDVRALPRKSWLEDPTSVAMKSRVIVLPSGRAVAWDRPATASPARAVAVRAIVSPVLPASAPSTRRRPPTSPSGAPVSTSVQVGATWTWDASRRALHCSTSSSEQGSRRRRSARGTGCGISTADRYGTQGPTSAQSGIESPDRYQSVVLRSMGRRPAVTTRARSRVAPDATLGYQQARCPDREGRTFDCRSVNSCTPLDVDWTSELRAPGRLALVGVPRWLNSLKWHESRLRRRQLFRRYGVAMSNCRIAGPGVRAEFPLVSGSSPVAGPAGARLRSTLGPPRSDNSTPVREQQESSVPPPGEVELSASCHETAPSTTRESTKRGATR